MSNQHVLKIHPAPLADLMSGAKTAEVRRNDRGFQVGDTVRLMEVNPDTGNWTGAADHVRTISHIQTGYGLPDGLCVLSYAQAEQQEAKPVAVEAQGAQAGDERAAFERKVQDLAERFQPDYRRYGDAGEYKDATLEWAWKLWQARAALATQPAAGEPIAWIYEDELPEGYPYDAMFPFSKVDIVRMFPVFGPPAAAPVAAGEPVAWECYEPASEWNGYKGRDYLSREKPKGCSVRAVPLGRIAAPPAAAHGDEAVRKPELVGYFSFCEDKQKWLQQKSKGAEFNHLFTPLYAMRAQGEVGAA